MIGKRSSADIPQMWRALTGLWEGVRIAASNQTVAIPVVGGALSGVGLPPIHLLRIIILSILIETRIDKITQEIRIVLHPDMFGEVDLNSIKREWS